MHVPFAGRGGGLEKISCGFWLSTVVATIPNTVTNNKKWSIVQNKSSYICAKYKVVCHK